MRRRSKSNLPWLFSRHLTLRWGGMRASLVVLSPQRPIASAVFSLEIPRPTSGYGWSGHQKPVTNDSANQDRGPEMYQFQFRILMRIQSVPALLNEYQDVSFKNLPNTFLDSSSTSSFTSLVSRALEDISKSFWLFCITKRVLEVMLSSTKARWKIRN